MKKLFMVGSLGLMLFVGGCGTTEHKEGSLESNTNEVVTTEQSTTQEYNGSSEGGNGNPNVSVTTDPSEKYLSDFFESRAQGTILDRLDRYAELVGRINNPEENVEAETLQYAIKNMDTYVEELPVETEDDATTQEQLRQMVQYYKQANENFKEYQDTGDINKLNKGNEMYNEGYTLEVEVKRGTNLL